jgi:hypothetical protein
MPALDPPDPESQAVTSWPNLLVCELARLAFLAVREWLFRLTPAREITDLSPPSRGLFSIRFHGPGLTELSDLAV